MVPEKLSSQQYEFRSLDELARGVANINKREWGATGPSVSISLFNQELDKKTISSLTKSVHALCKKKCVVLGIDLASNEFGDEGCIELCKGLSSCTSLKLKTLNLGGNLIGDAGVKHLSYILEMPELDLGSLNLRFNAISDEGMAFLSVGMEKSSSLDSINVSANRLSAKSGGSIGRVSANNGTLTKVDLFGNELGDEGVAMLVTQILTPSSVSSLESLNLWCNKLTEKGAVSLSNLIKSKKCRLKELHLGNNSISDEGTAAIATAMNANGKSLQLTSLDLGENDVGNEGALKLSRSLAAVPSLTFVSLRSNKIKKEGCLSLARVVSSHPNLRSLNISGNMISAADSEEVIAAGVSKTNSGITHPSVVCTPRSGFNEKSHSNTTSSSPVHRLVQSTREGLMRPMLVTQGSVSKLEVASKGVDRRRPPTRKARSPVKQRDLLGTSGSFDETTKSEMRHSKSSEGGASGNTRKSSRSRTPPSPQKSTPASRRSTSISPKRSTDRQDGRSISPMLERAQRRVYGDADEDRSLLTRNSRPSWDSSPANKPAWPSGSSVHITTRTEKLFQRATGRRSGSASRSTSPRRTSPTSQRRTPSPSSRGGLGEPSPSPIRVFTSLDAIASSTTAWKQKDYNSRPKEYLNRPSRSPTATPNRGQSNEPKSRIQSETPGTATAPNVTLPLPQIMSDLQALANTPPSVAQVDQSPEALRTYAQQLAYYADSLSNIERELNMGLGNTSASMVGAAAAAAAAADDENKHEAQPQVTTSQLAERRQSLSPTAKGDPVRNTVKQMEPLVEVKVEKDTEPQPTLTATKAAPPAPPPSPPPPGAPQLNQAQTGSAPPPPPPPPPSTGSSKAPPPPPPPPGKGVAPPPPPPPPGNSPRASATSSSGGKGPAPPPPPPKPSPGGGKISLADELSKFHAKGNKLRKPKPTPPPPSTDAPNPLTPAALKKSRSPSPTAWKPSPKSPPSPKAPPTAPTPPPAPLAPPSATSVRPSNPTTPPLATPNDGTSRASSPTSTAVAGDDGVPSITVDLTTPQLALSTPIQTPVTAPLAAKKATHQTQTEESQMKSSDAGESEPTSRERFQILERARDQRIAELKHRRERMQSGATAEGESDGEEEQLQCELRAIKEAMQVEELNILQEEEREQERAYESSFASSVANTTVDNTTHIYTDHTIPWNQTSNAPSASAMQTSALSHNGGANASTHSGVDPLFNPDLTGVSLSESMAMMPNIKYHNPTLSHHAPTITSSTEMAQQQQQQQHHHNAPRPSEGTRPVVTFSPHITDHRDEQITTRPWASSTASSAPSLYGSQSNIFPSMPPEGLLSLAHLPDLTDPTAFKRQSTYWQDVNVNRMKLDVEDQIVDRIIGVKPADGNDENSAERQKKKSRVLESIQIGDRIKAIQSQMGVSRDEAVSRVLRERREARIKSASEGGGGSSNANISINEGHNISSNNNNNNSNNHHHHNNNNVNISNNNSNNHHHNNVNSSNNNHHHHHNNNNNVNSSNNNNNGRRSSTTRNISDRERTYSQILQSKAELEKLLAEKEAGGAGPSTLAVADGKTTKQRRRSSVRFPMNVVEAADESAGGAGADEKADKKHAEVQNQLREMQRKEQAAAQKVAEQAKEVDRLNKLLQSRETGNTSTTSPASASNSGAASGTQSSGEQQPNRRSFPSKSKGGQLWAGVRTRLNSIATDIGNLDSTPARESSGSSKLGLADIVLLKQNLDAGSSHFSGKLILFTKKGVKKQSVMIEVNAKLILVFEKSFMRKKVLYSMRIQAGLRVTEDFQDAQRVKLYSEDIREGVLVLAVKQKHLFIATLNSYLKSVGGNHAVTTNEPAKAQNSLRPNSGASSSNRPLSQQRPSASDAKISSPVRPDLTHARTTTALDKTASSGSQQISSSRRLSKAMEGATSKSTGDLYATSSAVTTSSSSTPTATAAPKSNSSPRPPSAAPLAHRPSVPTVPKQVCKALYDWKAMDERFISIKEGEVFEVQREEGGWYFVTTKDGNSGFIPPSYVSEIYLE